jgi:hypothetical protein
LGFVALAVDAALRRWGKARPAAGLCVPLVVAAGCGLYAYLALTAAGAPWSGDADRLAAVGMIVGLALGALVGLRLTEVGLGWKGLPRALELAAVVALALCATSFLALRSGWIQSVVEPTRGSFLLLVSLYPLGIAAALLLERGLLRLARRMGRAAFVFRPAPWFAVLLAGSAALARPRAAAAAGGAAPAAAPNIVLVVVDGARHDAVSALAKTPNPTPGFDAVASHGALFEQARSAAPACLQSHLALLTGTLSSAHGVTGESIGDFLPGRRKPAAPRTLAERLAGAGYATAGFSNNPWVGHVTGLDAGFQSFFQMNSVRRDALRLRDLAVRALDRPWEADDGAERTARAAIRWMKRQRRPFFLFLNLAEPMPPWAPPFDPFLVRTLYQAKLKDVKTVRAVCEDPQAYWIGALEMDWRDWHALVTV